MSIWRFLSAASSEAATTKPAVDPSSRRTMEQRSQPTARDIRSVISSSACSTLPVLISDSDRPRSASRSDSTSSSSRSSVIALRPQGREDVGSSPGCLQRGFVHQSDRHVRLSGEPLAILVLWDRLGAARTYCHLYPHLAESRR